MRVVGRRRGGGGGREGPSGAPFYCGRAFRMAFTSSATAVSANSNWSCRETKEEGRERAEKEDRYRETELEDESPV